MQLTGGMQVFMDLQPGMLLKWREISNSKLEKTEKLEQLRLIDAGYEISTFVADEECLSIDTEEQLAIARSKVK